MPIAPGRHSRKLDPVLNDVMNLTVGQLLRLLGPQIWNARIKTRADIGSAAAVNAVAHRAAAEKKFAPLRP